MPTELAGTWLLPRPGVGFVEDTYVAADFQGVALEPDGTFVGLAVHRVVDLAAFPLVAVPGETGQDVDAQQLAAAQALVGIVYIELPLTPLQPDDLSEQLVAALIDLHIRLIIRRDPLSKHILRISGYGHQRQNQTNNTFFHRLNRLLMILPKIGAKVAIILQIATENS